MPHSSRSNRATLPGATAMAGALAGLLTSPGIYARSSIVTGAVPRVSATIADNEPRKPPPDSAQRRAAAGAPTTVAAPVGGVVSASTTTGVSPSARATTATASPAGTPPDTSTRTTDRDGTLTV